MACRKTQALHQGLGEELDISHKQHMDKFKLISILLFEQHAVPMNIGSAGVFMFQ